MAMRYVIQIASQLMGVDEIAILRGGQQREGGGGGMSEHGQNKFRRES